MISTTGRQRALPMTKGGTRAVDEIGGIEVRGPTCLAATGACRKRTRKKFTADGWFR